MNLLLESGAADKLKQDIRFSWIQRGYNTETVSFTRMADGSAEDYLPAELEKQLTAGVADRVLGHLRGLERSFGGRIETLRVGEIPLDSHVAWPIPDLLSSDE